MKWDGQGWSQLGKGIVGDGITSLIVYQDKLWVGGYFSRAGSFIVDNLAIWDGSEWCRAYGDFNGPITCMEVFRDTLYVGGGFNHLEGDPLKSNIVRFDPAAAINCDTTVGINPYVMAESISIYPNPAINQINLKSSGTIAPFYYMLFDVNGKEILSGEALNNAIDVSGVEEGLYLIKISIESEVILRKCLINR